jgi:DNA repair exonuclease SbcCD ATPase subunit
METAPEKKFNPTWIYIPLILVLGGIAVYLFLDRNKSNDKNDELSDQVSTVLNDKASVETEYNAALARLDKMKGESVQMDSLLSSKNDEVEQLKEKIKTILQNDKATEAQLQEAAKMIGDLNKKLSSFQEQIVALKKENIQLTEDKRQLTEDKQILTKQNEASSQEKENLKEEKKQLENNLEKTVETASILHASNFRLEAINLKKNLLGKSKEQETARARKADLMRMTFDLDENRISESGEKMIYICVTDPGGKIASSSSGGQFSLADGAEKTFTATKIVPYKKGEKVKGVISDWKPLENFAPGNYKVELYHMGNKIGTEIVTLK